jgi:hypothetical protein
MEAYRCGATIGYCVTGFGWDQIRSMSPTCDLRFQYLMAKNLHIKVFNVQERKFTYIGETNHGALHEYVRAIDYYVCPYGPLQPQEPKHHPMRLPFEQQYCWKYQVHLTYPGGGQTSAA